MGVKPLGMGVKPLGMGVKPLGMGGKAVSCCAKGRCEFPYCIHIGGARDVVGS